jgi:hypothetical protein
LAGAVGVLVMLVLSDVGRNGKATGTVVRRAMLA